MTINFQTTPLSTPRSRLRVRSTADPQLFPLRQHPSWTEFAFKLGQRIVSRFPETRQIFLELLDEVDSL